MSKIVSTLRATISAAAALPPRGLRVGSVSCRACSVAYVRVFVHAQCVVVLHVLVSWVEQLQQRPERPSLCCGVSLKCDSSNGFQMHFQQARVDVVNFRMVTKNQGQMCRAGSVKRTSGSENHPEQMALQQSSTSFSSSVFPPFFKAPTKLPHLQGQKLNK